MNIGLLARKTLHSQPGGDTVQVKQSAAALERLGHTCFIITSGTALPKDLDALHFFNLGRPADALSYFKNFPGKKIISTVFVDYSRADQIRFPRLSRLLGSHRIEFLKTLARAINGSDKWPCLDYLRLGQKRSMKRILDQANVVITSSMSELTRISEWSNHLSKSITDKHRLIPLGLDDCFIFNKPSGKQKQGILLVGRIEHLKNQLQVIQWATKNNWPLTVVGDANANQPNYYKRCIESAGAHIDFIPHQSRQNVLKLMQAHRLLIVPSFFETYSIVAWEAAALGLNVIANDVDDMRETLAEVSQVCDFTNEESTLRTISENLLPGSSQQKKSQAWFENYTWDAIGLQLEKVYQ